MTNRIFIRIIIVTWSRERLARGASKPPSACRPWEPWTCRGVHAPPEHSRQFLGHLDYFDQICQSHSHIFLASRHYFPPTRVMKSCNHLPWVVKAIILSIFEEVSPAVAVLKSGVNVWWDPLSIRSFIRTFRSTGSQQFWRLWMFNVNLPVGYWTRVARVHWRRPVRL